MAAAPPRAASCAGAFSLPSRSTGALKLARIYCFCCVLGHEESCRLVRVHEATGKRTLKQEVAVFAQVPVRVVQSGGALVLFPATGALLAVRDRVRRRAGPAFLLLLVRLCLQCARRVPAADRAGRPLHVSRSHEREHEPERERERERELHVDAGPVARSVSVRRLRLRLSARDLPDARRTLPPPQRHPSRPPLQCPPARASRCVFVLCAILTLAAISFTALSSHFSLLSTVLYTLHFFIAVLRISYVSSLMYTTFSLIIKNTRISGIHSICVYSYSTCIYILQYIIES